jgi:hypothetical protein
VTDLLSLPIMSSAVKIITCYLFVHYSSLTIEEVKHQNYAAIRESAPLIKFLELLIDFLIMSEIKIRD